MGFDGVWGSPHDFGGRDFRTRHCIKSPTGGILGPNHRLPGEREGAPRAAAPFAAACGISCAEMSPGFCGRGLYQLLCSANYYGRIGIFFRVWSDRIFSDITSCIISPRVITVG